MNLPPRNSRITLSLLLNKLFSFTHPIVAATNNNIAAATLHVAAATLHVAAATLHVAAATLHVAAATQPQTLRAVLSHTTQYCHSPSQTQSNLEVTWKLKLVGLT
jgi:hypothetical protein